jgi:NADH:ubiquinone oxidoreductase subunit 2 (subunit N)
VNQHLTLVVSKRKQPTREQDAFMLGGILAVLGLYVIVSSHDLLSGFFLLGLGIVFMASSNKEFRKELWHFFFGIFKGLWEWLSRSK